MRPPFAFLERLEPARELVVVQAEHLHPRAGADGLEVARELVVA